MTLVQAKSVSCDLTEKFLTDMAVLLFNGKIAEDKVKGLQGRFRSCVFTDCEVFLRIIKPVLDKQPNKEALEKHIRKETQDTLTSMRHTRAILFL